MGKVQLTDFYFYRWRYAIGYGMIVLLLAIFLLFVGQTVPGALSQTEMDSVVKSSAIGITHPETLAIPNMPYYVLQKFSIDLFGITPLGVKLPSLILAFVASIGAVLLLRRWFKPNVAILATLLLITTVEFLFIAQSGTPHILYIVWSVWLLLTATQVTNKDASRPLLWKILFFVTLGLSLYSPMSIFLIAAIIIAAVIHPHVRFVLHAMPKAPLFIYSWLTLIIAAPLAYLTVLNPMLLFELLGKPEIWPPNILHNSWQLFHQYFDIYNPSTSALITPVFDPVRIILIGLGAWQLIRTGYHARSYTIAAWFILVLPVLLLSPDYSSVMFVPFLILIASGLYFILRSWYGIFPLNPYARVVGLIPIVVLTAGLVLSSIDRYIYNYHYGPTAVSHFSRDSQLLTERLKATKEPVTIVVTPDEYKFYELLTKDVSERNKSSLLISSNPGRYFNATSSVIVSKQAQPAFVTQQPLGIIATGQAENSDRFYIYKNTQ